MVTRTQNMIVRTCLVYDKENDNTVTEVFTAKETDKKWERHISENNFVLLKVVSEEHVTYKLSMDEDRFFQMANIEIVEKKDEQ